MGNADGGREIFLWTAGQLISVTQQVTDSSNGSHRAIDPALNAAGDRVACTSNADGSYEVYLHRTAGGATDQITTTTAGAESGSADLDAAGDRVAFSSDADLTGANADENPEIFLHDLTTGVTTQQTNTTSAANLTPDLTTDGRQLAFVSSAGFGGQNPEGNFEVFVRDTVARTVMTMVRASESSFGLGRAEISGDGRRVAWTTDEDLTGTDPGSGAELFVRDFGVPDPLTGVTDAPAGDNGSISPSIDGDGRPGPTW